VQAYENGIETAGVEVPVGFKQKVLFIQRSDPPGIATFRPVYAGWPDAMMQMSGRLR
jgi:hypothetical protein